LKNFGAKANKNKTKWANVGIRVVAAKAMFMTTVQ
jgi:hypothetical protein